MGSFVFDVLRATLLLTLVLPAANDRIYGHNGEDELNGREGHDTLFGMNGNDTLYGAAGNDRILVGANNDRLYGGNGDDTLLGGFGDDTLWGGNGNDIFVFWSGQGHDVIKDFSDNDRIKIDGTVVSGLHTDSLPSGVSVEQNGDHLLIQYSGGTITLEHTTIADVFDVSSMMPEPIVIGGSSGVTSASGTDGIEDVFEIRPRAGTKLVIRHFGDEEDLIDISALGLSGFQDLETYDKGSYLQVNAAGQVIKIYGIDDLSQLSADDFMFA